MPAIHYTLCPRDPDTHLFEVSCTVTAPNPEGQCFQLPAWIPGSYMIRDFARHIVTLRAEAGGKPVTLTKKDKHTWCAAPLPRTIALTLHYQVYAWDLSVRGAHLDATHGFFNGTSVFLAVMGQTTSPCIVDIQPPQARHFHDWRIITALPRDSGSFTLPYGFGRYRAASYDELIDHPVEMGHFTLGSFQAGNIPHDIALTGRHDCDMDRLCTDLARICNWQIELFGGSPPMDYYAFLTQIVGNGYGGLEHRASTALMTSRNDLPWKGMGEPGEGYIRFLGLCSHEYFHTWNIKQIKPAAFIPYDLTRENYTTLLWAFEGFTSYYDDLTLVRTGLISPERYLALLGKTISAVLRGTGRLKQSVAESSFDAWIKYYRQDENTPNAVVSYYAKGALIALALDLQLRHKSKGKASLDTLMRILWERYGQTGKGIPEDALFEAVAKLGAHISNAAYGRTLARWLRKTVYGTEDLPLAHLLKPFGVHYHARTGSTAPSLNIRLASTTGEARIACVHDNGAAQCAGLAAGDILIALNGIRVDSGSLETQLERLAIGARVPLHYFRHDVLYTTEIELADTAPPAIELEINPREKAAQLLRRGWLGC